MIYLDTSAAAKALVAEAESDSIRRLFEDESEFIASRLLAVELHAIVDRRGLQAVHARQLLERVSLASMTDAVAERAIDIRSGLRTLDALHLATALTLGPAVTSMLSFDAELSAAALRHGIPLHPRSGSE